MLLRVTGTISSGDPIPFAAYTSVGRLGPAMNSHERHDRRISKGFQAHLDLEKRSYAKFCLG